MKAFGIKGTGGVILVSPTRIIALPGLAVFVKESDAHGDTWVRVK